DPYGAGMTRVSGFISHALLGHFVQDSWGTWQVVRLKGFKPLLSLGWLPFFGRVGVATLLFSTSLLAFWTASQAQAWLPLTLAAAVLPHALAGFALGLVARQSMQENLE